MSGAQRYPPKTFTTKDFVRAMTPIKLVLESFQNEFENSFSVESQGRFATLIAQCLQAEEQFGPSESYLKSLVRLYVSRVEASDREVEDETLLELILHFTMMKDCVLPNPLEPCHASFRFPKEDDLLRLRVYPRHNNVALKMWEAGACLAEYLLMNPQHVAGKACCELGAGVGLSALVVTGCCHCKSIHLTDYTEAGLINLKYNIEINKEWFQERIGNSRSSQEVISQVSVAD